MVLGSILDWVVFRTLDASTFTLWWITTKSITGLANGVYSVGSYMIVPRKKTQIENSFEMLPLPEHEMMIIRQQNDLLREQNKILRDAIKYGIDETKI